MIGKWPSTRFTRRNEDIACHHCIPIGIIRLSVINSLSNLNGSRTISCPDLLLFLFLRWSSRRAFLLAGTCRQPILQRDPWTWGSLLRNEKKSARSLRKIRMFLGLVDHSHWSGEWNSNSSASSFHLRVHQFRWPDNITRRFWWIKYGFEMEANNMVGSS